MNATTPERCRRKHAPWPVLAAGAVLMVTGHAAGATPACPAITETQALAAADVVFDGIAQPGPAEASGVLSTPARFSVIKYLKGSGPSVVSVAGGPTAEGGGTVLLTSAGVEVRSGEEWVVYAKGEPASTVETSICYGTHAAGQPGPFATESPSPSPSPTLTVTPFAPLIVPGEPSGVWAVAGIGGLAVVIAIGWTVARVVVGTK